VTTVNMFLFFLSCQLEQIRKPCYSMLFLLLNQNYKMFFFFFVFVPVQHIIIYHDNFHNNLQVWQRNRCSSQSPIIIFFLFNYIIVDLLNYMNSDQHEKIILFSLYPNLWIQYGKCSMNLFRLVKLFVNDLAIYDVIAYWTSHWTWVNNEILKTT
jgi:hypothetical protein